VISITILHSSFSAFCYYSASVIFCIRFLVTPLVFLVLEEGLCISPFLANHIMADPAFLAGFVAKGIDIVISQILYHANIAIRCRKELKSLKDLVTSIGPIATQISQYHLELNRMRRASIGQSDDNDDSEWVIKLHDLLLQQALPIVHKCTVPRFNVFSRYQMSRKISGLISEIKKHLELVPLVLLEQQTQMHMEMLRESSQVPSYGVDLFPRLADHHLVLLNINLNMQVNL